MLFTGAMVNSGEAQMEQLSCSIARSLVGRPSRPRQSEPTQFEEMIAWLDGEIEEHRNAGKTRRHHYGNSDGDLRISAD